MKKEIQRDMDINGGDWVYTYEEIKEMERLKKKETRNKKLDTIIGDKKASSIKSLIGKIFK